jgi:succinoglycan biosynthesis protein ExoL
LRFVDLLIVSSPAFHRNFYLPVQGFQGPWFLLENKLLEPGLSLTPGRAEPIASAAGSVRRRPWVIGYFGLIRGQATLDLIARVASRLRGTVEFQFRGVLTTINDGRFQAALDGNSNILYEGEYSNPADLPNIYARVDFAWALDLENIQANSRWLLPCRFYEAGAFGVPCLAAADFEVGRRIEELGVGWTFKEPFEESIVAFFSKLSNDEYEKKRSRLRAVPRDTFVIGAEDRSLAREIDELLRRRSPGTAPARRASLKRAAGSSIAPDVGVIERRF